MTLNYTILHMNNTLKCWVKWACSPYTAPGPEVPYPCLKTSLYWNCYIYILLLFKAANLCLNLEFNEVKYKCILHLFWFFFFSKDEKKSFYSTVLLYSVFVSYNFWINYLTYVGRSKCKDWWALQAFKTFEKKQQFPLFHTVVFLLWHFWIITSPDNMKHVSTHVAPIHKVPIHSTFQCSFQRCPNSWGPVFVWTLFLTGPDWFSTT